MGTICAQSYTNIFMDHIESNFIYPFIKTLLDDIFFIWTGSKIDLEKFLNELNIKHPSIKFEYEISKEKISFLDTEIYIKNNKFITKYLERKQTAKRYLTSTQSIQSH